jgi:4-aminobutyrate aminotransferase
VPATKLTEKFIRQAYLNGLLLLSCGQSTIRFMPPLMVTKEHVDEAVAILDARLGETLSA